MGRIEENNAFLLGMASKGVIRVREVVEKGGGGAVAAYEEVGEVAGYKGVGKMLGAWQAVEEAAGYRLVGAVVVAYEEVGG